MIQIKTLDFTGKKTGSIVENPNIGYMNGVEFTQTQYDQIFNSELRVTSTDILTFEFVIPDDVIVNLLESDIYYKSKMVSGENELRCNDKAIYNDDINFYKQKMLATYAIDVDMIEKKLKFKIVSTGDYGIYEVKVDVSYDDNGLNSYTGNYVYDNAGESTTVYINRKKLEEIITELESRPTNSISYVTFSQVPSHDQV